MSLPISGSPARSCAHCVRQRCAFVRPSRPSATATSEPKRCQCWRLAGALTARGLPWAVCLRPCMGPFPSFHCLRPHTVPPSGPCPDSVPKHRHIRHLWATGASLCSEPERSAYRSRERPRGRSLHPTVLRAAEHPTGRPGMRRRVIAGPNAQSRASVLCVCVCVV